jgi:hypothetical protein
MSDEFRSDELVPDSSDAVIARVPETAETGLPPFDPTKADALIPDPDEPHGYDFGAVDQHEVGLYDSFGHTAKALGLSQEQVNELVAWQRGLAVDDGQTQEVFDQQATRDGQTWAKENWGPEYATNISLGRSYLNSMSPVVSDAIMNARTEDGTPLLSHPDGLRWLVELARGGGRAAPQNLSREEELEDLREQMRNPKEWSKNLKGQARYRDLISGASSTPQTSGRRYSSLLTKVGNKTVASDSAIAHELEQLRGAMKNRQKWFRDDHAQRRYQQLLRMKEEG